MFRFERRALLGDQAGAPVAVEQQQGGGGRREQRERDPAVHQVAPLDEEVTRDGGAVLDIHRMSGVRQFRHGVEILPQQPDHPNRAFAVLFERIEFVADGSQRGVELPHDRVLAALQGLVPAQYRGRFGHGAELHLEPVVAGAHVVEIVVDPAAIQEHLGREASVGDLELRRIPVEAVVGDGELLRGFPRQQPRIQQVADRADGWRDRQRDERRVPEAADEGNGHRACRAASGRRVLMTARRRRVRRAWTPPRSASWSRASRRRTTCGRPARRRYRNRPRSRSRTAPTGP